MTDTIKQCLLNGLIYSAKNAVNALLTNASLTIFFPQFMQWGHSEAWWANVGKVALVTVLSREAIVWGPKLLSWSETSSKG